MAAKRDCVPKLKDLVYELRGVDWNELGIQLDVPKHVLNSISRDNPTEARKLSEVLQYWLNNGEVSWKVIIKALKRIDGHKNIIEVIETEYITPESGSTPTMPELLNFNAGDRNINIPREIGSKYHNFGAQLLQDNTSAHIEDLERQYQRNGEDINRRILQEWLDGTGRKPITWTTLVKVLSDIGMGELAKKLEES